MSRLRSDGFTMIELLLVIAIIAILAAMVLPVFNKVKSNNRYSGCIENLKEIGSALSLYRSEHEEFPAAPNPKFLNFGQPSFIPFATRPADLVELNSFSPDYSEWRTPTDDVNDTVFDFVQMPVTTTQDITDPTLPTVVMSIKNYGLATLYWLYLQDERNYLTNYQLLHCPAQTGTATVKRSAKIDSLQANNMSDPRRFDPLWAGYNSYDRNYNYDQFNNEIKAYDEVMYGSGGGVDPLGYLDIKRQLRFTDAPGDTVVCWCNQHGAPQGREDPVKLEASAVNAATARAAENARITQARLVLWLDGSVAPVKPHLQKSLAGDYYWVPPFLYTRGEAQ